MVGVPFMLRGYFRFAELLELVFVPSRLWLLSFPPAAASMLVYTLIARRLQAAPTAGKQ